MLLIWNIQGGPKVGLLLSQYKYFKVLFTFKAADFKTFHFDCKEPGTEIRLKIKYIVN